MVLANINILTCDEVQLLADCCQPVFVLEVSVTAQALIARGLLHSLPAVCQHSNHRCFILATTGTGRWYLEAWIERHGNEASDSARYDAPAVQVLSAASAVRAESLVSRRQRRNLN
jgi:hypothetical protein